MTLSILGLIFGAIVLGVGVWGQIRYLTCDGTGVHMGVGLSGMILGLAFMLGAGYYFVQSLAAETRCQPRAEVVSTVPVEPYSVAEAADKPLSSE